MRRFIFPVFLGALSLTIACSPTVRLDHAQAESGYEQAANILTRDITNRTEQVIMEQALKEVLYYIHKRYGERKYREFMRYLADNSLHQAVYRTFHKSFYQLSYEMLKNMDQPSHPGPMIHSDSGPFRFHYHPGSRAEADLEHLKYIVDRYVQQIRDDVLMPRKRWQVFQKNLEYVKDNRIHIYLYDNNKQSGIKSIAETSISYTISHKEEEESMALEVAMRFDYYGLLSSYTFVHEMSHAILGLSRGDFQAIRFDVEKWKAHPDLADKSGDEFYRAWFKHPDFQNTLQKTMQDNLGLIIWAKRADVWEEGMAEYLVGKYNLFQQYGLVPAVNSELGFYLSQGQQLTPIPTLLKTGYRPTIFAYLSPRKIYKNYQQGHSWIQYLAETFGQSKVLDYYFKGSPPETFQSTFGAPLEVIDQDWRKSLTLQHN